jgi:hypothetical protein
MTPEFTHLADAEAACDNLAAAMMGFAHTNWTEEEFFHRYRISKREMETKAQRLESILDTIERFPDSGQKSVVAKEVFELTSYLSEIAFQGLQSMR